MTTKDNNEAASAPDLRAVLIEVQNALKIANETPGGPICDTIWMPTVASETLFDFIEAALEAASASQSSTAGAAKGGNTIKASFEARHYGYEFPSEEARDAAFAEFNAGCNAALAHIEGKREQGAVAYCKACNAVGMSNCGSFDECGGPQCVTCHQQLLGRSDLAHVARQRQEPENGCARCYLLGCTCRECKDRGATPSAAVAEGVDTAEFPKVAARFYMTEATEENPWRRESFSIEEEHRQKVEGVRGFHTPALEFITVEQGLTYGAQQREAGRRDLVDELRTLCGKFGWREDGSGAVLLDRIAHQIRDLKACIAAHDALARQPVSEGLTREKVVALADEHSNGRSSSGRYLFGVSELMSFANALAVPPAKAEGISDEQILQAAKESGSTLPFMLRDDVKVCDFQAEIVKMVRAILEQQAKGEKK